MLTMLGMTANSYTPQVTAAMTRDDIILLCLKGEVISNTLSAAIISSEKLLT